MAGNYRPLGATTNPTRSAPVQVADLQKRRGRMLETFRSTAVSVRCTCVTPNG
jgi:hypothetical protein